MIAVCLLTADRPGYTLHTVQSFLLHNQHLVPKLTLLHADDGSANNHNDVIARNAGFETVYRTKRRQGQGPALEAMWSEAVARGAERILHLENDWEFVAPIPLEARAPCIRLYGMMKMRVGDRAPTGTRDLVTNTQVAWDRRGRGWEAGQIHWGGPPSITDAEPLLWAVRGRQRIKDISNRLSLWTMRPTENIVWHIGHETTPEHRG